MKSKFIIRTISSFYFFIIVLNSCQDPVKTESGLVTIDILTALKTEKEFRLSEMVDSIEYVKLETRPECLVSSASMVIGEKYIVLLNYDPRQILLFDRKGKFIRTIGKIGKGPGEYSYPIHIDLNPDETAILVKDERTRKFMEYSMDGEQTTLHEAPIESAGGPYYLDKNTILFTQIPWEDTTHFPRAIVMNLQTGEQKPLYYFDYKVNPEKNLDFCYQNDIIRTDDGILLKDALNDTIYQVMFDRTFKPVYLIQPFSAKPMYYCLTEQESAGIGDVTPDCFAPGYIFFIGNQKERFHVVYNTATKEAFRMPRLTECRISETYLYGIINDLDGTKPVWFWANSDVRNNMINKMFQIIDLKETIKTDCFLKADLKTNQYRDQLKKLVEESSDNDNPIIRILHTK